VSSARTKPTPCCTTTNRPPSQQIVDQAVFYAELAGEYTIPPAYAELMYKTTVRGHSGTFRFKIKDKG